MLFATEGAAATPSDAWYAERFRAIGGCAVEGPLEEAVGVETNMAALDSVALSDMRDLGEAVPSSSFLILTGVGHVDDAFTSKRESSTGMKFPVKMTRFFLYALVDVGATDVVDRSLDMEFELCSMGVELFGEVDDE